jgi:hypothetical protein
MPESAATLLMFEAAAQRAIDRHGVSWQLNLK